MARRLGLSRPYVRVRQTDRSTSAPIAASAMSPPRRRSLRGCPSIQFGGQEANSTTSLCSISSKRAAPHHQRLGLVGARRSLSTIPTATPRRRQPGSGEPTGLAPMMRTGSSYATFGTPVRTSLRLPLEFERALRHRSSGASLGSARFERSDFYTRTTVRYGVVRFTSPSHPRQGCVFKAWERRGIGWQGQGHETALVSQPRVPSGRRLRSASP